MRVNRRLRASTPGGRIAPAAAAVGIARLALLGWLIAMGFERDSFSELVLPMFVAGIVMLLKGGLENLRIKVAREAAARVQIAIRKTINDKAVLLGLAWFAPET